MSPSAVAHVLQMVSGEIAIMKQLDHPNVVRLHDVIDDDDDGQLLVVMELMTCGSTSLAEAGVAYYDEPTARRLMVGSLLGLEALHAQGVRERKAPPPPHAV